MRAFVTVLAISTLAITPALANDMPEELVGTWAVEGQCDQEDSIIHITADSLAMGAGEAMAIDYFEADSPAGNGAIHWAEEGNVDNFEYASETDQLLYNAEGYGMGIDPVVYDRCL